MQFINKAAISTGAASGMGLLFAQNWAAEGGNVIMCDVNEEVLREHINPNIPGYFEPTDEWNKEFSNDRIWS